MAPARYRNDPVDARGPGTTARSGCPPEKNEKKKDRASGDFGIFWRLLEGVLVGFCVDFWRVFQDFEEGLRNAFGSSLSHVCSMRRLGLFVTVSEMGDFASKGSPNEVPIRKKQKTWICLLS